MPTTKMKPTQPAAEPKPALAVAQPEPPSPRKAAVRRRFEALREIRPLLDISEHSLEYLEAVMLIVSRNHGCTTPAEQFIISILHSYMYAEDRGKGLTIDDVEWRLKTLKEDLPDAIEQSHFIAGRYPAPQPEQVNTDEGTRS